MKHNYIHLTFVIDGSGSMENKKEDIINSFNNFIKEQKEIKDGEVTASLYSFNSVINRTFINENINNVKELNEESYIPMGCTALNDAVGTAIDETGKFLADMKEEDRPSKVMIIIMTDGLENASKEYSLQQVKDKIKHQEDVYSWEFIYIGSELKDDSQASAYNIKNSFYGSASQTRGFMSHLNKMSSDYRMSKNASEALATMDCLYCSLNEETEKYEKEIGVKIKNNN